MATKPKATPGTRPPDPESGLPSGAADAMDQLDKIGVSCRELFDALQEGIWVIDRDAQTTFVNRPMAEMLGYTVENMRGRALFDYMDARGREIAEKNIARRKQDIHEQHEFEFLRRDGQRLYTMMATSPLTDADGNYAGAVAGVLDITARKDAEEYLQVEVEQRTRELHRTNMELTDRVNALALEINSRKQAEAQIELREKHYRSLFRDNPVAQIEFCWSGLKKLLDEKHAATGLRPDQLAARDPEFVKALYDAHIFSDVNSAALDLFRVSSMDEFTRHKTEFMTEHTRTAFLEACGAVRKGESYVRLITEFASLDGSPFWVEMHINIPQDCRETYDRAFASLIDISPRVKIEQDLLHYQEHLRALVFAMAHTEQTERQRIAEGLHNDIGQILLLSKLKLGDLIPSDSPEEVLAASEDIKGLLDQCIASARALTTDISPPILYELGFEAAAESLGRHLAREYGIHFRYMTDHEPKPMDVELQALLYQCIRALFRNITQHAGATRMELAVLRDEDFVRVQMSDNGKGGVELPEVKNAVGQVRYGLFIIREHIQYIGGTFEIHSAPDSGTQITLAVPLSMGPKLDRA